MLFNSYVFIFAFFPVVLFGFYLIGKYSQHMAMLWLALVSLFFYGWWDARFVGLLLGSIVFNFSLAYFIGNRVSCQSFTQAKILLFFAISCDLALLGYYKYANFFAENISLLTNIALPVGELFLPLGISFFTFTQIAYLVDTYKGKVEDYSSIVRYTLFVTYFPHLIAGPVLHHKEMMPQFADENVCNINKNNMAIGLGIFVLGLSGKILLADPLGGFASPIFNAASPETPPMLFEAWIGALAYTLQLYFDFSAYSDMAIGLSLMLNVRLPMNFNSPYQATSMIEFWRRWHMTLSRFLRDYLYIPMGGNQKGNLTRYKNLIITMLLGGLWHGAGWTFVIWGGLHGFYLMVNHMWRALKGQMGWAEGGRLANAGSFVLTFLAAVVGWVFFRAEYVASAMVMLKGMLGLNGVSLHSSMKKLLEGYVQANPWIVFENTMPLTALNGKEAIVLLLIGLVVACGFPNARQLFFRYHPTCEDMEITRRSEIAETQFPKLQRLFFWNDSNIQGAVYGVLFFLLIIYMASAAKSEFLYFQF